MAGQYILCWTADPDDEAPKAGPTALAKYLSMTPSLVKTIYQNGRMRIPCQTTQKWYYVEGQEDKDCEYGKIWMAIAAPLGNVTAGSSASVMIRLKWTLEFQMPALNQEATPEGDMIFASAGNYFTDSSGDWKKGEYLTFKWHEGGNITGFPGGVPRKPYKCDTAVYYIASNGTQSKTTWAVCVDELTEDGLPMLAPVKDSAAAMNWCKGPADTYLLKYYGAGPWVSPENPPWFEKTVTVSLLLTRTGAHASSEATSAIVRVSDHASSRVANVLAKFIGKDKVTPDLVKAISNLSRLEFTGIPKLGEALATFNYDPVRACSESSSLEVIEDHPEESQAGPSSRH